MAINTLNEKFLHGLGDTLDAENQFLKAQQEMLGQATNQALRQMIQTHIQQTEGHIQNVERAFQMLGQEPKREMCDGAKGIVSEGQKLLKETAGVDSLRDCAIAGAASKVEHYEISSYRDLIQVAEIMGRRDVTSLLEQNLEEEESTAQLIEQNMLALLQLVVQATGMQNSGDSYSQAAPTY